MAYGYFYYVYTTRECPDGICTTSHSTSNHAFKSYPCNIQRYLAYTCWTIPSVNIDLPTFAITTSSVL